MIIDVWLALFAAGLGTSACAFVWKKAALYTSLMNLVVWGVVAFTALDLTIVTNAGETVTATAEPVFYVAAANALVSLPVIVLAATGKYGDAAEDGGVGGIDVPGRKELGDR